MDLGLGAPACADRELTHPLARGMVVIRGAEQVRVWHAMAGDGRLLRRHRRLVRDMP